MICIVCDTSMNHLVADLYRCSECELISCSTPLDKSIYDKSYCLKYNRYIKTELNTKIQAQRAAFVSRHLERLHIQRTLLDYGCGSGSFLAQLDGEYAEVSGFDINPYEKYFNIDVLFKKYDVVTFWDSIEHLENPISIIKGLQPKSIFLSAPSTDDIEIKDILTWRHYKPEEHTHLFNLRSITLLLKKAGYRVIEHNYGESSLRTGGGNKNILSIASIKETLCGCRQ